MRTKLTPQNPFGPNRYGYLYEVLTALPRPSDCHLDYGSFDASVPRELLATGAVRSAVATDVVDIYQNFSTRFGPAPEGLELLQIEMNDASDALPPARFTTASILDALEHIHDQDAVLRSIHRALRPEGLLVVTVPKRHVFSFLDMGNWKFKFPTLHRWFITLKHSEQHYVDRYRDPASGLVGDIEICKSWHEHFSVTSLTGLLQRNGFTVREVDGAGLFARPLGIVRYLLPFGLSRLLDGATVFDARTFSSTHLFVVAVRQAPAVCDR
jgi:SAM-dependent methyltransferase